MASSQLLVFANRNWRYTVLVVFVLCLTLYLLSPHASVTSRSMGKVFLGDTESKYRPAGTSLEHWVAREESYYLESLEGRKALIKSYGPNPEDVKSFPSGPNYSLWDFFIPSFNCPHRIERLGQRGDGGKWMCGIERIAQKTTPCVVYSLGVERDSTFEEAFLKKAPNCEIWGYDYSVTEFGPQLKNSPYASQAHFFQYALGATDNHQANPPTYTLSSMMKENGHTFIDILKIDVEGSEFESLSQFVRPYLEQDGPAIPIGQMQIEIHAWGDNGDFVKFLKWWEDLERAGLRPFFTEPNLPHANRGSAAADVTEYSFINVKMRHALVADGF